MTQTGSVAEGRLSDWISLGVLASWVPRDAVDEAVEATGKGAKRKGGKLPPHVMVYFAMALALFAEEDYEETWVRLAETLADWGCWDPAQATVTTGGLTQARQRLGHEPVKEVFAQVAEPVATEDTPGAFLGPWRKMSMDGLEWDIPDTGANAAAFGYPGTGKDAAPAAFPKARAVTVGECASHAVMLAAIGPTFVCTAITENAAFRRKLVDAVHIDRLNLGPVPTNRLNWLQPHEGNIVDFLFRARAFQSA